MHVDDTSHSMYAPLIFHTTHVHMQVLWVDAFSQQPTMRHDLTIDRGMPFEVAQRRLAHERASPDDASGFRRSRRPMFGKDMILLATQKPGSPGLFNICRPNTGASYFDMEVGAHTALGACQSYQVLSYAIPAFSLSASARKS